MIDNMHFEEVTKENLDLACSIQNEIFPKENARQNYIEQIENTHNQKELIYYIVYVGNIAVGITGIYSYYEYPTEGWLGWFGILEKYRHNGYGGKALDKTISLVKEKGYLNFRLYTGEEFKSAHKLYSSRGMISEPYVNQEDIDGCYDMDIYIYSKSLDNKPIELWNNKNIHLKEQSEKEK